MLRSPELLGDEAALAAAASGWAEDPLWATVYDWSVEHPRVGRPRLAAWRWAATSASCYAAAAEIGTLPAGSGCSTSRAAAGSRCAGCGPGRASTYVAADIAQAMLDRTLRVPRGARGVADQVEPRLADVGALPLADGEFDLVVSFTGLHCFPDPRRAVREMARVLAARRRAHRQRAAHRHRRAATSRCAGPAAWPACSGRCARAPRWRDWLAADGVPTCGSTTSGAVAYFRGVKR